MTEKAYSTKEKSGLTVDLPGGGKLFLKPVWGPALDAAKATARKRRGEIMESPELLDKEGLLASDAENAEAMESLYLSLLIREIGARHVTGWEGVADESGKNPAECTPQNVRSLLKHQLVAKKFYSAVIADLMPDIILKKDFGTDAPGTSAAVPNTAEPAEAKNPPAPKAEKATARTPEDAPTSSTA